MSATVRLRVCAMLFASLFMASGPARGTTPTAAEFAIRWNGQEGGPRSGEDALSLLNLRAKHASSLKVGYYDLPATVPAPAGFSPILRLRTHQGGQQELTFKLRGDRQLADWSCPLPAAGKAKIEIDITFGSAGTMTRAYSYSCTAEGIAAAAGLSAKLKACTASVRRWERGDVTVEEWRLPGDIVMIEVSSKGIDAPAAAERFRARVVAPLLAAGIAPSATSKTALGSGCG
jgi:hypothetical protein